MELHCTRTVRDCDRPLRRDMRPLQMRAVCIAAAKHRAGSANPSLFGSAIPPPRRCGCAAYNALAAVMNSGPLDALC